MRECCRRSSVAFEGLGLWNCAEDLDEAIRDHLVFAFFELPNRKAETVGVAGMAMMLAMVVTGMIVANRRIRIASAQAASSGSHTPDTNGPRVGQLLHDFLPGDAELRGIDLPAVTRRHVAQSLRVELPR